MAVPNGSGKSALIRSGVLDRWTETPLRALSPDDIVLELRRDHPGAGEADRLIEAQPKSDRLVDHAISERRSGMVETVLSSGKFQLPVLRALKSGFEFGFVYVLVGSPDLNVARVLNRVREGGHDVPEDRIRARRDRSFAAVSWFAARATLGVVVDNSTARPPVLAEKQRIESAWRAADSIALSACGIRLMA